MVGFDPGEPGGRDPSPAGEVREVEAALLALAPDEVSPGLHMGNVRKYWEAMQAQKQKQEEVLRSRR